MRSFSQLIGEMPSVPDTSVPEQEIQKTSFPSTPTKNGYPDILTRKLIPLLHKRAPKAKDTHPNILSESYKTVPSQPANASDFLLVLLVFIGEMAPVHTQVQGRGGHMWEPGCHQPREQPGERGGGDRRAGSGKARLTQSPPSGPHAVRHAFPGFSFLVVLWFFMGLAGQLTVSRRQP